MNKKNEAKASIPEITPSMVKGVSSYRREVLEQEVQDGKFHAPGYPKNGDGTFAGKSALGNVLGLKKSAGDTTGTNANWRGAGGTDKVTPEVYSPLWLTSNLNLPRDRATINAWCRSYFALNPIVHNAILLHSTYPISKMNIKCKNPKHAQFFENMIEEIDLMNVCTQIAQEYWLLGEAFVYAELDESTAKWSRLLIQNPDYITVKRSVIADEPIISLRPDENLRRICTSNKPSDLQQRQQLDPSITEHVRRGENIPLSNFYVTHLARRIAPYEIRGTGLPVNIFKQLMLFDKFRENDYVQADEFINPLMVFKVGGGSDAYKPTPADLQAWKDLIESSIYDKNFKIITHDAFAVEVVNKGSGILDTTAKVQQIIKEMYTGLLVPQVIMDGGGDVTYANGGVSLDVLRQRYMQFRNMMSSFLRRKIFAPISMINEFYENIEGERVLIVPEIEWNHMSLFDLFDYVQQLVQLLGQEPRKVSLGTVYRSLGLEYEDENRRIKKEMVDQVIQAKEMESLQKMSLNELRALTDEDEIPEYQDSPLPGESPDLPGETPVGGGGGMPPDLGGPPPGLGGPEGGAPPIGP